jgi:hypothetical protein
MWICTTKTAGRGQDAVHALNIPFITSDKEANHFLHAIAMELEESIPEGTNLNIVIEEDYVDYGSVPAYVDNSGIPAFYEAEDSIEVPVGATFYYEVSISLKDVSENLKRQLRSLKKVNTVTIIKMLSSAMKNNSPLLSDALSKHYINVHALKGAYGPENMILPTEAKDVIYSTDTDLSEAKLLGFDFSISKMESKGKNLLLKIKGDFSFDSDTIEAIVEDYEY